MHGASEVLAEKDRLRTEAIRVDRLMNRPEEPTEAALNASSSAEVALLQERGGGREFPSRALTLTEMEEHLSMLIASEEFLPEDGAVIAEWLSEMSEYSAASLAKRDNAARVLKRFDELTGMLEAQRLELKNRDEEVKKALAAVAREKARLEGYVIPIVEQFGIIPPRLASKRLQGGIFALCLRQRPDHIEVTNEAEVPVECKRITLTLPLRLWMQLHERGIADGLVFTGVSQPKIEVSKTAVKGLLDAGAEVPGAEVRGGGLALDVKMRTGL